MEHRIRTEGLVLSEIGRLGKVDSSMTLSFLVWGNEENGNVIN
jgi:hypothetical protein